MIDCLVFSIVIALLIAVGVRKSRKIQSESAYLFAERKTGWAALTATLVMTEFNSATLISFSSLGYAAGYWALSLPFIFLIGLLFYAFSVAQKWKVFNGSSVAGFFRERYGKNLGMSASLLLLIAMLGFSAAYIKSLTLLFQPLFPELNGWIISALLLAVILAMSLRGGLVAIIRTDTLSLILTVLFFPLTAFFIWKVSALPEAAPLSLAQGQEILPTRFIVSLTVLTMFTYILAPWYGQKIFAARSPKVAYWSVITAALIIFALYASAILATALFRSKGFSCSSEEQALPALINRCLPLGFKGLGYALLFASSATTLTGVWSAMTAMWIADFSDAPQRGYERSILATACCAAISYVLANTLVDRVFDKLILANVPVAALSFGLLAGFYWKRASRQGVYLSIAIGCLCGVGAYAWFGEAGLYTWYWAIYGIPLTFLAGICGSLLFARREPAFQFFNDHRH